jgi:hypothetical protein
MNKLEILNDIVNCSQSRKVKCKNGKVYLDVCTAKTILLVYSALKEQKNKERFLAWDWHTMASFSWGKCGFKLKAV